MSDDWAPPTQEELAAHAAAQGLSRSEVDPWSIPPTAEELAAHQAAAQPERPSLVSSLAHGAGQGATLGFGDEVNGAIQALGDKLSGRSPGATLRELYQRNRDMFRREDAAAKDAHPVAYGGAQLAASIPATFLPGLNVAKGAGLASTASRLGLQGALSSYGDSDSKTLAGDALRTGAGGLLGAGVGAVSSGVGKLAANRLARVSEIDQAVATKAANEAADLTKTARSEAGTSAQDAYKQLEHIRELGRFRDLTPEQAQAAAMLEQELGQKAQEKLLPAVARKEAKAIAFSDAAASEGQRASDIAEQKLSPAEAWAQTKARLLRYGLPAVGGAIGAHITHGALGAGTGAMVGAGFRPMMHSLKRLAENPAIARPTANALGHALEVVAPSIMRTAPADASAMSPEVAAMLAALRRAPTPQAAPLQESP